MVILVKIIYESSVQAFQQLIGNKLRSFLSLLGITIGIWCIIFILSAIDSLESVLRDNFEQLGTDVIYISKIPWAGGDSDTFWKFLRRPNPSYNDFQAVSKKVKSASMVAYSNYIGSKTAEFRSNSAEGVAVMATSYDYVNIFSIKFQKGRYFSPVEHHLGGNNVIIGHEVAEQLFGTIEPVGRKIKILGRKMKVLGVIEKAGNSMINPVNFDDLVIMPRGTAAKLTNIKRAERKFGTTTVSLKAKEGIPLEQLKDEVTGVLRASRRIKPKEEDNFSLNEVSILTQILDAVFGMVTLAGAVIGILATIVGMFNVANIMFVSVKERTGIIGIKKALGARRYIILLEFLIEAVILCLLGGLFGLLLVQLVAYLLTNYADFNMFLSFGNIMIGIGVSVLTGVIAGIIPAWMASVMDPVEAIRS